VAPAKSVDVFVPGVRQVSPLTAEEQRALDRSAHEETMELVRRHPQEVAAAKAKAKAEAELERAARVNDFETQVHGVY
jgi:hypothetical protein